MKNKVLSAIPSILIVVMVLASGHLAAVEAAEPVFRLAYNSLPFNLPSIIEEDLGFLAQEGFAVQYHTFLVGHAMTEAMAAGDLDLTPVMGATSAIVSRAGGRDIKIIGCYSQAPAAFGLAVRPGSITLDQLRGKKIAVPLGTEVHVLLGKILAEQGLNLKDVQLVNLLIPDAIAALQSGQVDGAMVVEPVMSHLAQAKKIEVLRSGEGLISGLTLSVAPSHLVGGNKVAAFQRAHARSLAYLAEHYEKVLALAVTKLNITPEVAGAVAKKYTFSSELTAEHLLELEENIEFLYTERIIRSRISLKDLL